MSVKLPKSLKALFSEDDEGDENEEEMRQGEGGQDGVEMLSDGEGEVSRGSQEDGPEVEMNWNICKYLPEAASCQDIFQVSFHSVLSVISPMVGFRL